jgi:hypothetical protein
MKKRGLFALVMGFAAVATLAACDDPSAYSSNTSPTSPLPLASAKDPAIRESSSANPSFDVGQTVHITAAGIQPQQLVASCCGAVVFKNETHGPVSVIFNISKIKSGALAPGATWQWVPPNPESVVYHLVNDPTQSGQIEVQSPNW